MKKYCKVTFFLCVFLVAMAFSGGIVFAIEAWDGKLTINGFIRNDSAWRLEDGEPGLRGPDPSVGTQKGLKSGDYILSRNTLQVEGRWTLQDNLSATAIYRGVYEASIQLSEDLEQNMIDAGAEQEIDGYTYENDLREAYVDLAWGDGWAMRAGKQQIVWGEALGFRMSDIINPLDYHWNYFYPAWEDIRIPLWAIDITKRITDNSVLELVYLPGVIDNGFEPTRFGTAGTNWGPSGFSQFILDAVNDSVPENDISNGEFGARLKTMLGSWDTSLFWFYSRYDNPIFDDDWLAKLGAGRTDFFDYKFFNVIGGSFNVYSKAVDAVFRGEAVYTIDQPYNALDPVTYNTIYKDTFAYFVAIDKLLTIPFINDRNFVYLSMQFEQKYIFNYDDRINADDMADGDDRQDIITLYTDTKYLYEKLTPSLFLMYITNGEWLINPQVTYDINDYWSIGAGAQIADADDRNQAFFGGFSDNDQVYAFVKFGF